jgi:hypothetical protein
MSKEMLSGKSDANRAGSVGSTIVVEENKREERGGRLLLLLIAVGLGAVVLTSITVLAPSSFYSYVGSPGSINDSGDDAAAAIPTALASSIKATDGEGIVIEDNGVTKSGTMTITGYSNNNKYHVGLQCWIDSLPLFCSGDSLTISGLPHGPHSVTIVEPSSEETIIRAFSWNISSNR